MLSQASQLQTLSSLVCFGVLGWDITNCISPLRPCSLLGTAIRRSAGGSLEGGRRDRNKLLPGLLMSHLHCHCKGTSLCWLYLVPVSRFLQHSQNQLHYAHSEVSGLVWQCPSSETRNPAPEVSIPVLAGDTLSRRTESQLHRVPPLT